jgi:hypothetical protein
MSIQLRTSKNGKDLHFHLLDLIVYFRRHLLLDGRFRVQGGPTPSFSMILSAVVVISLERCLPCQIHGAARWHTCKPTCTACLPRLPPRRGVVRFRQVGIHPKERVYDRTYFFQGSSPLTGLFNLPLGFHATQQVPDHKRYHQRHTHS